MGMPARVVVNPTLPSTKTHDASLTILKSLIRYLEQLSLHGAHASSMVCRDRKERSVKHRWRLLEEESTARLDGAVPFVIRMIPCFGVESIRWDLGVGGSPGNELLPEPFDGGSLTRESTGHADDGDGLHGIIDTA